ncbi:MAG: nucleotidyltransferase domain-containing protein [Thermoproteus sp.]
MFRRILLESHAEIEEWIKSLCARGYTVVLFGSRARGGARIDSDWDLVVLGDAPPGEPPNDLAQVHYATPQAVAGEIARFNTIFVDAFYEGRLICGDAQLFQTLKELAARRTQGMVKTQLGWIAERQQRS